MKIALFTGNSIFLDLSRAGKKFHVQVFTELRTSQSEALTPLVVVVVVVVVGVWCGWV